MNKLTAGTKKINSTDLYICLFLYLIIWIAYFLKINHYGIYEDDTRFVAHPANLNFKELLELLKFNVLNIEGGQGRIIGFTLPQFLVFIMYNLGGLAAVYTLGTFIILINAFLVYRFVSKLMPVEFAVLAALIFILYPIDTTKPLLTHIFQLQLSLTFLLLAMNQYLKGKLISSYLIAFCSLLTYEIAFLPFLVVPLFRYRWNKKLFKNLVVHVVVFAGIFIILFMVRKLMGESRVSGMDNSNMVAHFILSPVYGMAFSAYAFLLAIIEVIHNFKDLLWVFLTGLLLFSGFGYFLYRRSGSRAAGNDITQSEKTGSDPSRQNPEIAEIPVIQLLIASFLMLLSSYLLGFTRFPPAALHGRATSVHLASSVAGSILATVIFYFIYSIIRGRNLRTILNFGIIILLSILLSRGMLIQNDFEKSWITQKMFWTQLVEKCPDIRNNTILLVDADKEEYEVENIYTFSWSLPEVLGILFKFDEDWNHPPKVVFNGVHYEEGLQADARGIYFTPVYPFLFENRDTVYLEDQNVICLEFKQNILSRRDSVLQIDSASVRTSVPDPDIIPDYQKQKIAKYYLN